MGSGAVGLLLLACLGGRALRLPRSWVLPLATASFFNNMPWLERAAFGPVSLWPALGVVYNMAVWFIFCCWAWAWAWFRIVALAPVAARGFGTMSIPVIGVVRGGPLRGEPSPAREVLSGLLVVVALVAVPMPGRAARASPAA